MLCLTCFQMIAFWVTSGAAVQGFKVLLKASSADILIFSLSSQQPCFLSSSPCPRRLWGPVSSVMSLVRLRKLTNATRTSASPRWHGTATSALSTPNLLPWLWTPAVEEPSWCCLWARWVKRNALVVFAQSLALCACSTFYNAIFGFVDHLGCKLVWCSFNTMLAFLKIWILPVTITHSAE